MKYLINKDYSFEVFDDGDVLATNNVSNRTYFMNKTTWNIVQMFRFYQTYVVVQEIFINTYDEDKEYLSKEFGRIFNVLLEKEIIKGEKDGKV